MKIIVKYLPYQWIELPLKEFKNIPKAVKTLLGNTGIGKWYKIRIYLKI